MRPDARELDAFLPECLRFSYDSGIAFVPAAIGVFPRWSGVPVH